MMRVALLTWLVLGAFPLLAEDPPGDVPLLDVDAVQPDAQVQANEFQSPEPAPGIELLPRSFSSDKQFIVIGGGIAQRASLVLESERVRGHFDQLLGIKRAAMVFPINIELHGKLGDPPRKRPLAYELRSTKESFLLRIHVDLARGINFDRMERAIITGLLYQRSLAKLKPGPLDAPVIVPVWLVEGLREAGNWALGQGDRKLYQGVFHQENLFSVDELFGINEASYERLDGASRAIFRVLSGALVMALLEQPRGKQEFVGFCDEVARYEGEMPILLRKYFPDMNLSEKSLAKWWALTLAKLSDAPVSEAMTIPVTEKALSAALLVHYRDDEQITQSVPFESWQSFEMLEGEARFEAIRSAQNALERLSYRCFPSYRPLLMDYQGRLFDWAKDRKLSKLDEQLAELSELRILMLQRSIRGRDYLDFMEIAGATELSGSFVDYMELIKELEQRPRPERNDPISHYLDTLEGVYGKKAPSRRPRP